MKKILMLLCAAVMGVTAHAQSQYPDISITDLKKAIDDKTVTVIDVNGSDSWKAGHVPGAIDFEADGKDLASKLPADKDSLVVAYCGGPGCNAYKAGAKAAEKLGYKNVKHLAAGIKGWKEAKQPVETGDKKASTTSAASTTKLVATVDGVVCSACQKQVKTAFASVGATNVTIAKGAKDGQALVSFEGDVCKEAATKALGEFALVSLEAAK